MTRVLICAFLMVPAFFQTSTFADEEKGRPVALQATASFASVRPSLLGTNVHFATLLRPAIDKWILIGPRLGFQWGTDSALTRWDIFAGVEGTLWVFNVIGAGMGFDLMAPSYESRPGLGRVNLPVRFRIEPHLAMRIQHLGERGAMACRIGIPYDTRYQWGIFLGLSFQFNAIW